MTSSGLNKVILVGKLGKNPSLRYLDSGQAMADIWVVCPGTSTPAKDQHSGWLPVRLWGEIAESTHKACRKGDTVLVEGQLLSHSWETPQGERHSRLEVVAQQVQRIAAPSAGESSFPEASKPLAAFDPLEGLRNPDEPDEVPF